MDVNPEHPVKAEFSMEVTLTGKDTVVRLLQLEKKQNPMVSLDVY